MYSNFSVYPIIHRIVSDGSEDDNSFVEFLKYFNRTFFDSNTFYSTVSFADEINNFLSKEGIATEKESNEKLNLLCALLYFFKEDFEVSKLYISNLKSSNDKVMSIKKLLLEFFNLKKSLSNNNSVNTFILSASFRQNIDLIQNQFIIEDLRRRNDRNLIILSQELSSKDHYRRIRSISDTMFLIGHSDGENYFFLNKNYKGNKFKKVSVKILKEKEESLKLLGLLNCKVKKFNSLKSIYDYLIIADTSTREYSEMFLKGFSMAKKYTNNYDFCIKIGILGLMLRTDRELVYKIYKNGKSFEWDT